MTFDSRAFRAALGNYPTGVAVIIAGEVSRPLGITVNSFASVSLEPPLVMWCLDRKSRRFELFTTASRYTVSILGSVHETVSQRLAGQGEHQLDQIGLIPTQLGPPALADALAVFECQRHALYDGGDHAILVGRVERFLIQDAGMPLVFFRGRYSALAGGEKETPPE